MLSFYFFLFLLKKRRKINKRETYREKGEMGAVSVMRHARSIGPLPRRGGGSYGELHSP
jgi:hypothetical protein